MSVSQKHRYLMALDEDEQPKLRSPLRKSLKAKTGNVLRLLHCGLRLSPLAMMEVQSAVWTDFLKGSRVQWRMKAQAIPPMQCKERHSQIIIRVQA